MSARSFPVPLAKVALRLMPAPLLARVVEGAFHRMEARHPKLLKNLGRLENSLVYLEPTDLPHRFGLKMGREVAFFLIGEEEGEEPDARVAGTLEALIDLLEGREDGDALFFSREIQVTGDTETIVALRNTLDREEMVLYEEVLSLCGPFAGAADLAVTVADQAARRVKKKLKSLHDEMHRDEKKKAGT